MLGATGAGIISLVLPRAAVAASTPAPAAIASEQPTGVTATPIGYASDGSTGAVRVTWDAVTYATDYEVRWSTTAGDYSTTAASPGIGTTADLTGLTGTDTTHHLVVVARDADGAASAPSDPASATPVIATGGTVTTFTGNGTIGTDGFTYVVHTFEHGGDTTFTLNRAHDLDLLAVAGGGGGGAWVGGGGGAGGMLESSSPATGAGAVTVTVGAGGRGAQMSASGFVGGTSGEGSSFGSILVVTGGGIGPSWANQDPGSGGSGGGGCRVAAAGAAGIAGQGSSGGNAFNDAQPHPTAGGGGAGGPGQNAPSVTVSGAGGPGRSSTITGSAVAYAGGGGGSAHGSWGLDGVWNTLDAMSTPGDGGSGGGGAGAAAATSNGEVRAGHGTAGLGGGGGGAANNCGAPCLTSVGGDGGAGVVIVRYALPS